MRSDTEIEAEITGLRKVLKKGSRWNDRARETIEQTVHVLERRMSIETIEQTYYVDETSDDYKDGDNDLYNDLMLVGCWLQCSEGYRAPSETL
jgi:hypothetical protein